ncbi:MAG: NAD(P)H-dependent oxidoreductase [Blastocatellia bacterium]|nr:NAD(P)H-dependent oxidoreductase [Blastocatellia bacterium]
MNIFIVLAHPEIRSFNGALFNTAVETLKAAGHKVEVSDLYRMNFHAVSDRSNFATVKDPDYFRQQVEETYASEVGGFSPEIEAEIKKIEWCDLMIWQFPLWWFSVPGILKGWIDRVFAIGRTYGYGKIYETGIFKGKKALLSLTTGGPKEAYEKEGFNGDINAILRPLQRGVFSFTGFDVLQPHIVYSPVRISPEERAEALNAFAQRLQNIEKEEPVEAGRF